MLCCSFTWLNLCVREDMSVHCCPQQVWRLTYDSCHKRRLLLGDRKTFLRNTLIKTHAAIIIIIMRWCFEVFVEGNSWSWWLLPDVDILKNASSTVVMRLVTKICECKVFKADGGRHIAVTGSNMLSSLPSHCSWYLWPQMDFPSWYLWHS